MRIVTGLLVVLTCLGFSLQVFAEGSGNSSKQRLKEKANLAGERGLPGKTKPERESKAGLQQKVLEKFDANGNGKLDPDEQAAARKAAAEERKNKKKVQGQENAGQSFDPGNGVNGLNGQPVGGGASGPTGDGNAKLLERFDFNRDGRLSAEEMARAKQFMQQQSGPGQNGGKLPGGLSGKPQFKQ